MGTKPENPRGLYQRPPGSGVWWINYYNEGKQRREKVGNITAARNLLKVRKAAILEGRKLPNLRSTRFVTLAELIDDAIEYVTSKKRKDIRNYESKALIFKREMGGKNAAEITPQVIDKFLEGRCKTNATFNRYKAFVSLCYSRGMKNGKVDRNPARLIDVKKEDNGRFRFLTFEEFGAVKAAIQEKFPERVGDFVFSVHTGMRLSEQYSLEWQQVNLKTGEAELLVTKNGSSRIVYLNADALAVLNAVDPKKRKKGLKVFPREGKDFNTRWWFYPCLEAAGIEHYVWHSNRHTFCSWLAMSGASIKDIQLAAGHKTITMSARYAHLTDDHQKSVVARIETKAA